MPNTRKSSAAHLIWAMGLCCLYATPVCASTEAAQTVSMEDIFILIMLVVVGGYIYVNRRTRAALGARDRELLRIGDEMLREMDLRRVAEASLKETRERYLMLSDNISDVIWAADMGLNLTYVSPSVTAMLGWSPEELLGKPVKTVLSAPSIGLVRETLASQLECLGDGQIPPNRFRVIDVEHIKRDGACVWSETKASFIPDAAGRPAGVVGVSREITWRKHEEAAIRESNERIRRYFDLGVVGMAIITPERKWIEVNDRLCEILGYTRDELLKKTWADITHPDDIGPNTEKYAQAMSGEIDGYTMEKRYVRKDGGVTYAFLSTRVVRKPDGSPDYILAIVEDITRSKQAEEELRRANEELEQKIILRTRELTRINSNLVMENAMRKKVDRALKLNEARLEALHKLSRMTDATTAEIAHFVLDEAVALTKSKVGFLGLMNKDESVFSNYAWSREVMYGCDVTQSPIHFEIASAGVWAEAVRQRRTVIINDYANTQLPKKGVPEGHVPLRRIICIPVFAEDRIVMVAAVANKDSDYDDSDIRQLTLLMDGMWHNLERRRILGELDHMFSLSQDLICIVGYDGRFRRVNPAFETILGYREDEAAGARFIDFVHPEDRQGTVDEYEGLERGGITKWFENRMRHRDGTYRWISWAAVPYTEDETIYAAGRDITERKRFEAALRASLDEKESLLREIHQRTKNDLLLISSLLKLQSRNLRDGEAAIYLRESQNRVNVISIIHEMLYQSADIRTINMPQYIHSISSRLFHAYEISMAIVKLRLDIVDINMEIDTVIPCGLILSELISNSLRYAFPGGRGGEIVIELSRTAGVEYLLSVRDNGVGLPEGVSLDATETLGLQLVGSLVRQMNGSIEVSREGGTLYTIRLNQVGAGGA